mgnify:CR=1 FL=1
MKKLSPLYNCLQLLKVLRTFISKWRREKQSKRNLTANYQYDISKFSIFGCPNRNFKTRGHITAYLLMLAHSIEKGLSFTNPHIWFGWDKAVELARQNKFYSDKYGSDWVHAMCCSALDAYLQAFETATPPCQTALSIIKKAAQRSPLDIPCRAGIKNFKPQEFHFGQDVDFNRFFTTRFSVRHFAKKSVSKECIDAAARWAQRAPSVCNRQSARLHIFRNDELGARILSCQNGNRGFGHMADKIGIITVDLENFLSIGERNQAWVDGGLFAMTFIWALHAQGLASCCLNWSVELGQDKRLRKVVSLPQNEVVIMLLLIGHYPEELTVPVSPRRPLEDIIRYHI